MNDSMITVSIPDIIRFFPFMKMHSIDNQAFICEISGTEQVSETDIDFKDIMGILQHPLRFDGFLCIFCVEGTFKTHINLNSYDVVKNDLVVIAPGNLINTSVKATQMDKDLHLIMIGLSKEFTSNIRIDFSKISQRSFSSLKSPVFSLSETQHDVARNFIKMSLEVMSSSYTTKKEILGCLASAAVYIASDMLAENNKQSENDNASISPRLKNIFDRFIELVTEYHTSERSMSFYADKLCLTPKYLSKLIKQASGRSAPEWIDAFVILEAKNLLKYSGCTIKEIVYKLHFPNQSVFYKYFKSHTGITPSEYRNS